MFETSTVSFVREHGAKGPLLGLFLAMTVDLDFQYCLIADVLKGLLYLDSIKAVHGVLDPSCCLLDERFTLKIAKFQFRSILAVLSAEVTFTESRAAWLAPEVSPASGNSSGPATDIYALGLLIATIALQRAPDLPLTAAGVSLVPDLRLQRLVGDCANREPTKRPKISQVQARLRVLQETHGLKHGNVVERTMAKFQTYAAVLEDAVQTKTQELRLERKKCDALLFEILPAFVAEKLRDRQIVEPEFYDSVSLYFSGLVGFAGWVETVPPEKALNTLSLLCSCLDEKIGRYSVYKVENIRDQFLITCGISPRMSETDHAAEICRMALALPSAIEHFRPRKEIVMRAGIHSGPCAAGVIGSKVPRYCLFGDAVNVASRMDSHGEPGRIHLTGSTAALIRDIPGLHCESRGIVSIKGKGDMETFWLTSHLP